MKQLISTSICFFLCLFSVQAAHILGGNMTYRTLELNAETITLELRLTVYRDANGSGADFDQAIQLGIYTGEMENWDLYTTLEEIPHNGILQHNLGNLPFVITDLIPSYESVVYSAELTLPRSLASDVLIAYQRCCRVHTLTNIISPEETGFGIQLLITEEALQLQNDSPQLFDIPASITVLGVENTLALPQAELDGDALSYSFCAPLTAGGTQGTMGGNPNACNGVIPEAANCLPPFDPVSFLLPEFDVETAFGPNNDISLDTENGTLSGIFNNAGVFNYGICIREERDNILLSEVYVDHTLFTDIYELTAIIRGKPFYDLNQNGIKETEEAFLNNIRLGLSVDTLKSEIRPDNTHLFFVNEGAYNMILDPAQPWSFTNDSIITITDLGQYYDYNPGLYPSSFEEAIRLSGLNDIPLCNAFMKLKMQVANTGSIPFTGTLTLYQDSLFNFLPSTIITTEPDYYDDDSIVWNLNTLDIDSLGNYSALFETPDETFVAQEFTLNYVVRNEAQEIVSTDSITDVIVCSADPNDKQVRPDDGTLGNYTLIGTRLEYIIRFENVGNYPAYRVVITDDLPSTLDISTLEVLYSSHAHTLSQQENKLIFTFQPIVLNPEEQGAIRFAIDHVEGIQDHAEIRNFAKIYFDSNQAIFTNFVSSIFVESTTNTEDEVYNNVAKIFPNPSAGLLNIHIPGNSKKYNYEIVNSYGQPFRAGSIYNSFVNIDTDLSPGLYLLILKNTAGQVVQTEKWIIQN